MTAPAGPPAANATPMPAGPAWIEEEGGTPVQTRRIVLIVFAAVIAAGTFQLTRTLGGARPAGREGDIVIAPVQAGAPRSATVNVLVAAADLPAGTLVTPEHLRWQAWPREAVDSRYRQQADPGDPQGPGPETYAGAVVRTGLLAGEPVLDGRLVKPGERGFLAALLNPDMRAVSVPVNPITGINGFIFPGDRVDVILTHMVTRNDDPLRPDRRVAETVLRDVRVLALDQRVSDQEQGPAAKAAQVATLEVTPIQAESLPLLIELGQLSLSLRSLARLEEGKGPKPVLRPRSHTLDSDVSALVPNPSRTLTVQVSRGGQTEEITFGRTP